MFLIIPNARLEHHITSPLLQYVRANDSCTHQTSVGLRQPDVTVRFHWPLNFAPVTTGKLVMYLPWEFGVIPTAWVDAINSADVDEVWSLTPSGTWCRK